MDTHIYKISSILGDKIYIGSTTKQLDHRLISHKYNYNAWKAGTFKSHMTSFVIFDEYGIENCVIGLLEMCPNLSTAGRRKKEGEYIKSMACVNHNIAGSTKADSDKRYRDANQVKIKKHVEDHRAEIKVKMQEWRSKNKEKIAETKKAYCQLNKEKIAENQRERRKKKALEKLSVLN